MLAGDLSIFLVLLARDHGIQRLVNCTKPKLAAVGIGTRHYLPVMSKLCMTGTSGQPACVNGLLYEGGSALQVCLLVAMLLATLQFVNIWPQNFVDA